ncbi:AAA family ATPase [Yersinia bercovieri]|uniref:AAA family ATPase n=1 Tax=Yersinia TaxID=629 RepID=UPI0005E84790|nr:AAA family ATPase [Yersinia bercovieri]CNJ06816.1 hemin importer ATP-binding subunit [Yersinia bercovieri]HDM8439800.1 AAA family ATPase [Yersinia enterocolitica]
MNHILSHFEIIGLHGYKNLRLEFTGLATIIVAENGTGKTTLLNALNNILTCNFKNLSTLNFNSIRIKFTDGDDFFVKKEELSYCEDEEIIKLAEYTRGRYSAEEILAFIIDDKVDTIEKSRFFQDVYLRSPYTRTSFDIFIEKIKADIGNNNNIPSLSLIKKIKEKLTGIEIIYLPTYRRVEKTFKINPIESDIDAKNRHRFGRLERQRYDQIAFGLSDVEKTLRYLSEQIERRSNMGYRNLSTTMLEDLLRGNTEKQNISGDLPDIDDLSRFLGRVESQTGQRNYDSRNLFEGISKQYVSGRIEKNPYLKYFLIKLQSVIESTKELESMIEKFVLICNGYLKTSSDSKHLSYDAKSLNVLVFDEFTEGNIKLDDLSSGEKQIISLMSILYLNKSEKIILIDEPELSLSLEWQKKVLPDIINSGTVRQLLAITHSPFVFDNELDKFTRDLIVEKVKL